MYIIWWNIVIILLKFSNGDNILCSNVKCTGSCCLNNQNCIDDTTNQICNQRNGSFSFNNTCNNATCLCLGGCCSSGSITANCFQSTQSSCFEGTYLGDTTLCQGICPNTGACCFNSVQLGRQCNYVTLQTCNNDNGQFLGKIII